MGNFWSAGCRGMDWFESMSPEEQEAYLNGGKTSSSSSQSKQSYEHYESNDEPTGGGGLWRLLFGSGQRKKVSYEQSQTHQSETGSELPRIVNIGGGNESQARKILEKISRQPGYGEDLKTIKEVRIANHLPYPDEGGIVPYGYPVNGYYDDVNKTIYTKTYWDMERTIKHELGHAMHGDDEDDANRYSRRHF